MERRVKGTFGKTSTQVTNDSDLSVEAKGVYAYLCGLCGSKDCCWPTHETMKNQLNMSEKRLSKYLNELRDKGYVEWRRNKKSRGFNNNIYTVIV